MANRARTNLTTGVIRSALCLALPLLVVGLPGRTAQAQAEGEAVAATAGEVPSAPSQIQFGFGARGRYVSVPSWFLGMFTKENTPLSSYHAGLEFFRRKGDMDVILGFSYQNMSPPDGNWLGSGKDPRIDTDYTQFKNLAMWGIDAAFVWHTYFSDYVGIHYGAGLGLGIITGKILRTSAGTADCATSPGNETLCHPVITNCPTGPCSEMSLQGTEGQVDGGPSAPHRFKEGSVPGALPILNVMAGLDLRIPQAKGLEIRLLEIGFYNAFFAGMGVAYLF